MLNLKFIKNICEQAGSILNSDTYCVFDIETTGTDVNVDRIVQYGLCIVKNKVPIENYSLLIKLPSNMLMPKEAEAVTHISTEMCNSGVNRLDALLVIKDILKEFIDKQLPIIGHNLLQFDVPFFERECIRENINFKFDSNLLIDTGALIKASQLGLQLENNETLRNYCRRVLDMRRKGIRWSLSFSVNELNLISKYSIDLNKTHDAGYDCLLTHYLLQEIKQA